MTKQAGKLDLNLMQTTGSALAALSSAVLLSTLGAAGTLIGAAVGSIVATVGGTVYSHYLSVSRQRMAAARSAALVRVSRGAGTGATATGGAEAVTRALAESPERFPLLAASARGGAMRGGTLPVGASPVSATPAAPAPRLIDGNLPGTRPSLRQMLRGSRWKPALAVSLGVFVLVMGAIVSMELATGRALSSYTGGSSADGPRTSIALLGSTSEAGGSTTTDPAQTGTGTGTGTGTDEGSAGSGDTTGSGAGSQSAGDSGSGSTAGSDSDTAPQPDTSTTDPDAGTPTEPAPEPAPTEPAPEPTPAPSTPAPAPAPATGAAVSGAAADSVS